jgi:hypothetical protein
VADAVSKANDAKRNVRAVPVHRRYDPACCFG